MCALAFALPPFGEWVWVPSTCQAMGVRQPPRLADILRSVSTQGFHGWRGFLGVDLQDDFPASDHLGSIARVARPNESSVGKPPLLEARLHGKTSIPQPNTQPKLSRSHKNPWLAIFCRKALFRFPFRCFRVSNTRCVLSSWIHLCPHTHGQPEVHCSSLTSSGQGATCDLTCASGTPPL